jgi:oligosaccharide reducing-end xylanase
MRHHPVQSGTTPLRVHPADPPLEPKRNDDQANKQPPHQVTVGPMVDEEHYMIVFVPGLGANEFSDPSYHLPAFYELWARWGPVKDRAFWTKAAAESRRYFVRTTNPRTGLAPDYANFDGSPRATNWNTMSANFSYDSWRTASNWSVDQSWWGENPDARMLSDRIQRFLFDQGIHTFSDRYTLDGKSLSTRHSPGMMATTATAGLAATDGPIQRAFLDALWATPVPSGGQRYYDGLLYMLSLLHTSGRFRIWMPPETASKQSRSFLQTTSVPR